MGLSIALDGVACADWGAGEEAALIGALAAYWGWYRPSWGGRPRAELDANELRARVLGQLNSAVMGLLTLPVARNSVWTRVFGVPWEAAVRFHVMLGRVFLACVALHASFWVGAYADWGLLPRELFAIDMLYIPSDWTVPLIIVASVLAFVAMGVLAAWPVRRRHFELFYYSHHVFLGLFVSALWHASMGWCVFAGVGGRGGLARPGSLSWM